MIDHKLLSDDCKKPTVEYRGGSTNRSLAITRTLQKEAVGTTDKPKHGVHNMEVCFYGRNGLLLPFPFRLEKQSSPNETEGGE